MATDAQTSHHEALNAHLAGYDRTMGLRFLSATPDEVIAEYDVGDVHRQPYGIVHGGVHCGVVEAVCSTGGGLVAVSRGQGGVVGIDNHTSFIRAVRRGRIRVRAVPITRGHRTHLWEAICTDGDGRVVSTGRVRLLVLDRREVLAGEPVRRGVGGMSDDA
jgi:1,4-dihydroxy-2-naphthoyl-CoA hydrolase